MKGSRTCGVPCGRFADPSSAPGSLRQEIPPPDLVYSGGDFRSKTAFLDGTVVHEFKGFGPAVSLSGGVLAGSRAGTQDVVGVDAKTGVLRFTVPDGRLPLIYGDRMAMVFRPTFDRDPFVNSVWY